MVSRATVTVEVDDRGRFTIPEPARKVITLTTDESSEIRVRIRVLAPEDAAENETTTTAEVDDRGRITIQPSSIREQLGIKDREAIVEATIAKLDQGEFDL
jgi:bifunctional DNA-binding transcriptional regulator/antitoxin component of YhaV-PrlF toxin-antitoxin module